MKSRPIRSAAFTTAGSAIVVRCPAAQALAAEPDLADDAGAVHLVDRLAVLAEPGGDPGAP
ncbi:hypothetical protein ACIQVL_22100 [Streptomyces sp. NPDC090499]|uniref:hypothetical protein n=1 Tax=unclassified Streptomyces TaxID=2593676 RepID=UPI0037FDC71A